MPTHDRPEAFGQHVSAEAATCAKLGLALLAGLAAMQPGVAAGAAVGASREERLLTITAMLLEQARVQCISFAAACCWVALATAVCYMMR